MSRLIQLVVFFLEGRRYALPLDVVERIVRAVEVTPLPGSPSIVIGAIDVGGSVIPVLNVRQRFQLPEREISINDHLLVARIGRRAVALLIDDAYGIVEHDPAAIVGANTIAPGLEQFHGVIKLDDGVVLIQDLEKFLSLDESRKLDKALDVADIC